MMIDTHCHLASDCYGDNIADIEKRACAVGVTHCITQGTHPDDDWKTQLALAESVPSFITPCLAVHPTEVLRTDDTAPDRLLSLAQTHPLGAIGEAGLDYYWPAPQGYSEDVYRKKQLELLEAHFDIARRCGLNISLHTRDRKGDACFSDAVSIARRFPEVRPVFHCFIGTREQAELIFRQLDGFISFTGIVTFKNAATVQETAAWCPPDRFMLETDAPYLAPEPYRGQTNEPAHVAQIAAAVAKLRGVSVEEIAEQTTQNARSFFRLSSQA